MATASQVIANPSNRLEGGRIPAEIKFMILQYTASHDDLLSLIEAYPEWVLPLWERYPKQLFHRAWENVLNDIDQDVIAETIYVYQIRKIREDYATAMGSSHETQQDRDRLENDLREVIGQNDNSRLDVELSLDSIFDLAKIVQDVNSLTHRYSNDAWRRIRHIAEETGTGPVSSTSDNPTPIALTRMERLKFNRAFLRVEIYLLTKYWTNAQDERHILDMGADIENFIPHSGDLSGERLEFDSCLRYMFHAYRSHLKKTAKELGVPELPTRDDLPWVRNWDQDFDYEFEDYPTFTTDDPVLNFSQRSISEEQRFLLWLCESGIGPLKQTHQVEDSERRDELIRQFGRRHIWDTVELRHRFSRYDYCIDEPLSRIPSAYSISKQRNKHPIMSLYGHGAHQKYSFLPSKWACASEFLEWSFKENSRGLRTRGDITLNEHGRWLTKSDTDSAIYSSKPFCLKDKVHRDVPHGHPYMMDREKYEFRSQPRRVHQVHP